MCNEDILKDYTDAASDSMTDETNDGTLPYEEDYTLYPNETHMPFSFSINKKYETENKA